MANQQILVLFLKALMAAKKSLNLYPRGSPLANEWIQRLHRSLQGFIQEGIAFPIAVGPDRFLSEGEEILTIDPVLDGFRFDLETHGVTEFSIDPAVEDWELQEFLDLLNQPPQALGLLLSAERYLRERGVTHVVVSGPAIGPDVEGPRRPSTSDPTVDNLERLVDAVVERVEQAFTDLVYDRGALVAWFEAVAAGDRAGALETGVQMLGRLAEETSDREVRLRTTMEALLGLPEVLLRPLLTDWLVPAAASDLVAFNLLTQLTEDEMSLVSRLVPQDRLLALASELLEFPWEEGKRQRLVESIAAAVQPRVPDAGLALETLPTLSRDDPVLVALRTEITRACEPEALLERSMQILLALLLHVENEEYPGFALDALEDMMGEALARRRMDLSLDALTSLLRAQDLGREWMREHPRRMNLLVRRLGSRAHVSLVVGVVRSAASTEQMTSAAEYLRLLGREAAQELTVLLAEEKSRRVRARLCQVLARIGSGVVPVLLPWVDDGRWYVVRNVVHTLGKIRNESAFMPVVGLLDHSHPRVRVEAVRAVGLLGGRSAVGPLLRSLGDEDAETRGAAIKVLGSLRDDGAVPALRQLVDDRRVETAEALVLKQEAINALAAIGSRVARQVLLELASRRVWFWRRAEKRVREMAAGALRGARAIDLGPDWSADVG